MDVDTTDISLVDGRLRLSVRLTGLVPHESISLNATAGYSIGWMCGDFVSQTEGADQVSRMAGGGEDGVAVLEVDLRAVVPPACQTNGSSKWQTRGGACWEDITVTEATNGLRVTREPACTGP
jgi:hypothetical protein